MLGVKIGGMKRHAESCARCSTLESGLQATLDVGVLPLEEPSDDLEDRILDASVLHRLSVVAQDEAVKLDLGVDHRLCRALEHRWVEILERIVAERTRKPGDVAVRRNLLRQRDATCKR